MWTHRDLQHLHNTLESMKQYDNRKAVISTIMTFIHQITVKCSFLLMNSRFVSISIRTATNNDSQLCFLELSYISVCDKPDKRSFATSRYSKWFFCSSGTTIFDS